MMQDAVPILAPFVLGIIEGLTEFVPVSSTGHLILASWLLGYTGDHIAVLEVVIQIGAILAVCWIYRARLTDIIRNIGHRGPAQGFAVNVALAVLPALIVGALAHDFIKAVLFSPKVVAISLVVGGLAILAIEWIVDHRSPSTVSRKISPKTAFGIGVCQLLALVPGISRAGATIMGGLILGVERKAATEFSFFLAIPTMFGAAALDIWKDRVHLSLDSAATIGIGTAVSFGVALIVVRWLVGFVSRHGFALFGFYRIVVGLTAWVALDLAK